MSLQAQVWALYSAPVTDAQALVVLWALAERADEHGRGARPAQESLARVARCSDRTVRRHLADLERDGLIVRGDQALVSHLPPGKRPVVWDVCLWKTSAEVTGQSVRPDRSGTGDRTLVSDRTVLEPTNQLPAQGDLSRASSPRAPGDVVCPVCDGWHRPGVVCSGTVPARPGALRDAVRRERSA